MHCHDEYQWVLLPVFIEMRNVRSGSCRTTSFYTIHVILYAECKRARLNITQFKRSFRVAG